MVYSFPVETYVHAYRQERKEGIYFVVVGVKKAPLNFRKIRKMAP